MRVLIINCLIILSMAPSHAQNNLICNGDFEININCPHGFYAITDGMINFCSNPIGYSPDYFNTCDLTPSAYFQIPINGRGNQLAKTGNAYIGLDLWEKNAPAREYVQIRLKETLKPNHNYAFECYLSRAEKFRYAVSNFGAYFSVDSVSMPTADILPFVPQINNPAGNYFTDTLNWMPFSGTFLAQGGEQYVILGNFNPASQNIDTLYQYYGSASHSNWAYYYIDDVSLIESIKQYSKIFADAMKIEYDTITKNEETRRMFRFTDSEAETKRDGLTFDANGIVGFPKKLAQMFTKNTTESWNKTSTKNAGFKGFMKGLDSTKGFIFFTTDKNTFSSQVNVGRDFYQYCLALTKSGYYMHPLNQAIQEYTEMDILRGDLDKLYKVKSEEKIQMIARIGKSDLPFESYRRHLDNFDVK